MVVAGVLEEWGEVRGVGEVVGEGGDCAWLGWPLDGGDLVLEAGGGGVDDEVGLGGVGGGEDGDVEAELLEEGMEAGWGAVPELEFGAGVVEGRDEGAGGASGSEEEDFWVCGKVDAGFGEGFEEGGDVGVGGSAVGDVEGVGDLEGFGVAFSAMGPGGGGFFEGEGAVDAFESEVGEVGEGLGELLEGYLEGLVGVGEVGGLVGGGVDFRG